MTPKFKVGDKVLFDPNALWDYLNPTRYPATVVEVSTFGNVAPGEIDPNEPLYKIEPGDPNNWPPWAYLGAPMYSGEAKLRHA